MLMHNWQMNDGGIRYATKNGYCPNAVSSSDKMNSFLVDVIYQSWLCLIYGDY